MPKNIISLGPCLSCIMKEEPFWILCLSGLMVMCSADQTSVRTTLHVCLLGVMYRIKGPECRGSYTSRAGCPQ